MSGSGYSFDREKIHLNVARMKVGKDVFEVVIDPDLALELRSGKSVSMHDVLKDEMVFTEARKGLRASEHKMQEVFGTSEPLEVARTIIMKGEVQETTEHRAKLVDEKKRKIIGIIHRNAVDPRNHIPHPIDRIERAMEEAKVRIDTRRGAEEQVEEVLNQIRPILPIKFETKQIQIRIPSQYGAKCYSVVKGFGKMLKDQWLSDGSWLAVVEIPGGLEPDLYDKLNAITHGNVETEVIGTK